MMDRLHDFRQKIRIGKKCETCGENDIRLLEFAHYDRKNKNTNISYTQSIKVLEAELEHGRFLCVWCHRLETRKELDEIVKNKSYEYTDIEMTTNTGESKKCTGPVCNGKIRDLSFFYLRTTGKHIDNCKKCVSYQSRLKRMRKVEYVNNVKLNIGECAMCSVKVTKETFCCFDFDHIDRKNKTGNISYLVNSSIEKIDKEIAKCRLLCCKCHKLHTIEQMGYINYNDIRNSNLALHIFHSGNIITPPAEIKPAKLIITIPEVKKNKCKDCSVVISKDAERCEPCYRINSRKCQRPSLNVLLEDVKKLGYCGTGRKYGVTDNAIRKWIKQYQK